MNPPQQMSKSIDEILYDLQPDEGYSGKQTELDEAKQAIYDLLASEADLTWKKDGGDEEYVSIGKLREVFGARDES